MDKMVLNVLLNMIDNLIFANILGITYGYDKEHQCEQGESAHTFDHYIKSDLIIHVCKHKTTY